MEKTRLLIQLPTPLKAKLDNLRSQGYTATGFIRALLERELSLAGNESSRRRSPHTRQRVRRQARNLSH